MSPNLLGGLAVIALSACAGKSISVVDESLEPDAPTLSILAAIPIPTASCTEATPCAIVDQCFDHLLASAGEVPACHVLAVGAGSCVSPMVTPSAHVIAQAGLADSVDVVCEIPPVRKGASCVAGLTESGGWCYEPGSREGLCAAKGTSASGITFMPLYLSNVVVMIECPAGT